MEDFKPFPKISRLKDEEMWITEKIDGANAHIHVYQEEVTDGEGEQPYLSTKFICASRNRYLRDGESDNFGFRTWCKENENFLIQLPLGRHYGEWWGRGIQRGYNQSEKKFWLFNQSMRGIEQVIPCINFVPVLYHGPFNLDKITETMEELKNTGSQAAPGFMEPEGVVVYLRKASIMFKKTFDDNHKGEKQDAE